MSFRLWFYRLLPLMLFMLLLSASDLEPATELERVRAFTRDIEFDFVSWTVNALEVKLQQSSLSGADYLNTEKRRGVVLDYVALVADIQAKEALLRDIYADPNITDPESASKVLRHDLDRLIQKRGRLGPLTETILQAQLAAVVADEGLTLAGQPLPPVLYHGSPLPLALIVSPRHVIRQDQMISLVPGVTVDDQVKLERQVDQSLNVSSLVVGIGGIGTYPTMVMQTTDLSWLAEVVAHEWIHNYLTLRPLGLNYLGSPELRTMNETAAGIAGRELGRLLIERYFPEKLPPPPPEDQPSLPAQPTQPPTFDFRAEMRETRLAVDKLLESGKIDEAETYMEKRRVVFWENGYHIRKLNQAYFAFHGAYADEPGGPAGEDPVGAAVRGLRQKSTSLAGFINRISWMWSYEQLIQAINPGR